MILKELSAFVRSFFLQALWNFERMQNVGFAFSLAPLLRRAAKSDAGYAAMLRRHAHYFNTHPYFAPIVIGVVYHREAARNAEDQLKDDAALNSLKESMGGAFGAIGDHVMWGTYRPFAAIVALSVGLVVSHPLNRAGDLAFTKEAAATCGLWWVTAFLAVFNVAHLWLRWRGLQKACHEGPLVVKWVQSLSLQAWAAQLRRLALLLLAVLSLYYLSRWASSEMLIWMVAVLLGTIIMKRWALSSTAVFYIVCGASVTMTSLGIHWP